MNKTIGLIATLLASNVYAYRIVSFNGKFSRWSGNQIHYQMDSRGSKNFDGDAVHGCDKGGVCVTVQDAIEKSFASWSKVPGVDLDFIQDAPTKVVETNNDGKNQVTWVNSGWQNLSFFPPAGALAVTISTYKTSNNEIVDSDIHFNGTNFDWADINSPEEEIANVVDIQNIATHEIGHFIGLDHSSEDIFEPINNLYMATMFFASGPGETFRRDLAEDDQNAGITLYPQNNVTEPRIDSVSPTEIDASQTKLATVRIRGNNFLSHSAALLAVNTDEGDADAKVISISDNEMNVVFDVSRLRSGKYDLVVANSFDRMDRFPGALSIQGGLNGAYSNENMSANPSTGCSVTTTENNNWNGMVFIFLPFILILLSRVHFFRSAPSRNRMTFAISKC